MGKLCINEGDRYGRLVIIKEVEPIKRKSYNERRVLGWKPSDEQMDALDSTLQYSQVSHNSYEHLNSLYNDLKKLTE